MVRTLLIMMVLMVGPASAGNDAAPVQPEVVKTRVDSGADAAGQADEQSTGSAGETWHKTKETSERAWSATRDGASSAAAYTYRKAGEAWEATTEGTGKAIRWSREKAGLAWGATREGAGDAADWTREKSGQVWDATRETAAKAGDAVKRGYDKAREKTRDMVDGDD